VKRILIFTAGFGEGHNTAARNIRDAIEYLAEDDADVEILDLFDSCYGRFNDLLRRAYLTAINKTPRLWQGFYHLVDRPGVIEANLMALARMRKAMEEVIGRQEPDVVVSTYPIYHYLLDQIYADGRRRSFSKITVITDSITVNSLWYRCQSDYLIVANEATAETLRAAGVPDEKIKVLGFPVQLEFTKPPPELPDVSAGGRPKILYLINSGKKKAPRVVERLIEHDDWDVTISAGRDPKILEMANAMAEEATERVRVMGWTSQMPNLIRSHHIMVSKAGGATVQEAIAGLCPIVVNQIVPGQEEGNYELLKRINAGVLAEKPKEIIQWLERAFADNGSLWQLWRRNIASISLPDSSLRIAQFILEEASPRAIGTTYITAGRSRESHAGEKSLLYCDFHMHTTFSDGKLTVAELVDFYGQREFDCICITDHLCDPSKLLGQTCNLTGLVLPPNELGAYFETIAREAERAWRKYGMMVMTGVEFNKDAVRAKNSAHLLGIDLKKPIDPRLDLKETITAIHEQGGLAVAAHPHKMASIWGKNTLFLWENQDEYAPLIDAWEIANRDDIFNPVGLKKLPFLANSDFHKPKHIYSWKTVLFCERNACAIKDCIRLNRDVSITLYRDHRMGAAAAPPPLPLAQEVVSFAKHESLASSAA
jgi:UDP-N-acetylglucosamine:LPS N-acetylglucosamine transferase/histidinol phosphatase-like PHP family hydrolase